MAFTIAHVYPEAISPREIIAYTIPRWIEILICKTTLGSLSKMYKFRAYLP